VLRSRGVFYIFIIFISLFVQPSVCSDNKVVKIGVLAKRGTKIALKRWSHTATYLNNHICGYAFKIVPLSFDEMIESVKKNKIDFVLTNSMYYVELEYKFRVSRIVTLKNFSSIGQTHTHFGGVIFTRKENKDINELKDIAGKNFAAVDKRSFGGWVMARKELADIGIEPDDLGSLKFLGSHDKVVYAIKDAKADVGTVRTDTLERMALEKKIDLSDFKIINKKHIKNFSFALSTDLYPEWPFAKLKNTPEELSKKVVIALLEMQSNDPAAITGKIGGWTIPLDYTKVHEVLRELRIAPYDTIDKITVEDILKKYRYWIVLFFITLIIGIITALYIAKLNRSLEKRVKERTKKIEDLLKDEKEMRSTLKAILDTQENMIVLSDGKKLSDANSALLDFFGYKDLESFKKEHRCICDFFKKENGYVYDFKDKNWIEHILENKEIDHKVKIYDKKIQKYRIFLLRAADFLQDNKKYIISLTDISKIENEYKKAKSQAIIDKLTSIYNRAKFDEELDIEIEKAKRYKKSFCVIMFDIDDFKKINDTFGHDFGDMVLKQLSAIVKKNLRKSDFFARWGGEEFMIIVFNADKESAFYFAEKLRSKIESAIFGKAGKVTCSFGIAKFKKGDDREKLLKRVDKRLYEAKRSGKNIVIYKD
jgi:diguanylate cyclase (GGDEF)-like protein